MLKDLKYAIYERVKLGPLMRDPTLDRKISYIFELPSEDKLARISRRMSSGMLWHRSLATDWQAWQRVPYICHLMASLTKGSLLSPLTGKPYTGFSTFADNWQAPHRFP